MPAAYFERLGEHRFRATEHTGGAWALDEQHIAPTIGLVVHEIERACAGRPGLQIGRLAVEILGVIGIDDVEVEVAVLRPGRTVELVEATVTWAGRAVVRARAWRVRGAETGVVAGGLDDLAEPMPAPDDTPTWDMTTVWPGGYIASLDVRRAADARPGRARAWVTSSLDLVAGEPVSPLARFLSYADTANGISVRTSPQEWMFPNLDLTVHLLRQPMAGPTGLDTTVTFAGDGLGLTSSVLHDVRGPVGRLAQTLTVRPIPASG